jgi:hypothetical protein
MGAKIEGAGTATIRVHGVAKLHGARYRINPDRIEAGTFLIAGAITGGDLIVANCNPAHLGAVIAKLREAACIDVLGPDSVRVRAGGELRAADISTEEYPGFPTDMQAQYMALATQAEGVSLVRENIFENRFMHVQELVRMGANIKVDGRTATVRGPAPALLRRRHVLRSCAPPHRWCWPRWLRRRRVHPRPRLPHGPRLRAHRREAARRRRADPPHGQRLALRSGQRHRQPAVAALADGRIQLDRAQKRHVELLGRALRAAARKDVDLLVAVRAGEVAHVLHNAQHLHVHLRKHLQSLARVLRLTSLGVDTTTAPVSGTVCTSEIATSPVPGGRSTIR